VPLDLEIDVLRILLHRRDHLVELALGLIRQLGLAELEVALVLAQDHFVDEALAGLVDRVELGVGLGADLGRRSNWLPARRRWPPAPPARPPPALVSTSVMRPSFLRVRSCVSSIARPCESTFSFTSPTLVRTNFLVAQAVDPPIASTTMGTATKNFRNISILLVRRRA
jgi:hypothetical protein